MNKGDREREKEWKRVRERDYFGAHMRTWKRERGGWFWSALKLFMSALKCTHKSCAKLPVGEVNFQELDLHHVSEDNEHNWISVMNSFGPIAFMAKLREEIDAKFQFLELLRWVGEMDSYLSFEFYLQAGKPVLPGVLAVNLGLTKMSLVFWNANNKSKFCQIHSYFWKVWILLLKHVVTLKWAKFLKMKTTKQIRKFYH